MKISRKSFHLSENLNYFHQKAANDMKVHIKNVLNMNSRFENSTVDKYISSVFNLNNVNPTYIFRLPDKKNRTLVLRKSDFTAAVFPNITNVNKFKKSTEKLVTSSSSRRPIKAKNEEFNDELKSERFIFENNLNNNEDNDENMKHIVEENVRTEQDFIKTMSDLNEDLREEDLRLSYHEKLTSKKPEKKFNAKKNSEDDEWDELGLSGWSGSVAGSKSGLPKKDKCIGILSSGSWFSNCSILDLIRKRLPQV